ncbi:MAG: hypothetical protein JXB18_03525 [Sedimentisphaerales bacterium]|nr:hypothetical protein [Sedimentisphaerales bacterium]
MEGLQDGLDIDGNGSVNIGDFALFADQGQNGCDLWRSCAGADFNMSGQVDIADLHLLVSAWLDEPAH